MKEPSSEDSPDPSDLSLDDSRAGNVPNAG